MSHNYDTTAGRVAALREMQSLLSQYTAATQRPAFGDLVLFDTLVEREADHGSGADYTVKSAEAAMSALLDARQGLAISGYFWDSVSDDVSNLLADNGLAADDPGRCESCGADISDYAAGETECVLCTGEDD